MAQEGDPGRGRGRGRGRGKTELYKRESYKPGPKIYQQLWRIRKEPAIVTASPLEQCPINHAQTRILDRRQTKGAIIRNYYVVQITHADDGAERYETEYVDLSRILQYVSPAELERFENEQFRLEAEAEAIVVRAEIEELARRRLQVNARGRGRGRGRIVSTSGLPPESQPRPRGRPRGARGRGRGRPRAPSVRSHDTGEEFEDDFGAVVVQEDEESHRIIPETEDEEEMLEYPSQSSPGLMRSAFVANSALSVSPMHSTLSISTEEAPPMFFAQQDQESDEDGHRTKRLRVDSPGSAGQMSLASTPQIPTEAFAQAVLFSDRSSVVGLDSSPYSQAKAPASLPPASLSPAPEYTSHAPSAALVDSLVPQQPQHNGNSNKNNDSTKEEYAIEIILEHYYDGGKIYYLVKWEGYENSHDWLSEEDLDGARELVAEYKRRVGLGRGRKKKGAFFS